MSKVNRLTKLTIDELSGVDAPANMLPGFLVMKAECAEPNDEVAGLVRRRHSMRHPQTGRFTPAITTPGGDVAAAPPPSAPLPGVPHNDCRHVVIRFQ